jgi:transcriptional regulator with XRE-family HTH domain
MSVGLRIKAARENKNLTLDEVAKRCNTTKQTIFKYENEIVTNIPYDKLVLLSKALDVSPSYLFEWEEEDRKENSPDEYILTEGERRLIELLRKFPEDRTEFAVSMVFSALENMPEKKSDT